MTAEPSLSNGTAEAHWADGVFTAYGTLRLLLAAVQAADDAPGTCAPATTFKSSRDDCEGGPRTAFIVGLDKVSEKYCCLAACSIRIRFSGPNQEAYMIPSQCHHTFIVL